MQGSLFTSQQVAAHVYDIFLNHRFTTLLKVCYILSFQFFLT